MAFKLSLLTLLLGLFLQSPANAEVTINNITLDRFSQWKGLLAGDPNATTTTIYGGYAGSCTSTSPTSVCNSCVGATNACNTRAIHPDLIFQVFINFPSGNRGEVYAEVDDNTNTRLDLLSGSSVGQIDPGSNVVPVIQVSWGEICQTLFGMNDDCTGTPTRTSAGIRFGIFDGSNADTAPAIRFEIGTLTSASAGSICDNGEAAASPVCNFIAYPGDSKVFIENVRTDCSFPGIDDSDLDVVAVRAYYTEDTVGTWPTIATTTFKDLTYSEVAQNCTNNSQEISLSNNEVTGLTNATKYRFAMGIVDEAGNVGLVTDMATFYGGDSNGTDENLTTGCYNTANPDWAFNCHVATPGEVIGLISDEMDCFIATATYGTPFKPRVKDFRAFRNRYLKSNLVGRWMINTYYHYSPPMAQWIDRNPQYKPLVHVILTPLWWVAHWSLKAPGLMFFFLTSLLSFAFVFFMRRPVK